MSPIIVRIGSRGSDLALAQARHMQRCIGALPDKPQTELIIIKTSGDANQSVPLSQVMKVDDRKGMFTKEIEEALVAKKIDLAVHSFKDLPSDMDPTLHLAAIPERVHPYDVIVARKGKLSDGLPGLPPGSKIGTSSARRMSQLEFVWPGFTAVPIRGNVPTRIRKAVSGDVDASLLARAGIERLKIAGFFDTPEGRELWDSMEMREIPPELFVPAPAQGALALQCRSDDFTVIGLLDKLRDRAVEASVAAERIVLGTLSGGCHLPLGAHCRRIGTSPKPHYQIQVYLGKEAEDNRRGRSFQFTRRAPDAELLGRWAAQEIKEGIPVVLTGREDRIHEITSHFAGKPIIAFPTIEIERAGNDDESAKHIATWSDAAVNSELLPVIAMFSSPAVQALADIVRRHDIELPRAAWAVTGQRTAESVSRLFPSADIRIQSPDGTGEGLGRRILEERHKNASLFFDHVFAVAAERGREEFQSVLENGGMRLTKILPYKSAELIADPSKYHALPAHACIVFGSPSSVRSFFEGLKRAALEGAGFRYAAIGPTTAQAVVDTGRFVYAESRSTDYVGLVNEFL